MPSRTRPRNSQPWLAAILCAVALGAGAERYSNNFTSAEVGKVPQEFQVASGAFAVAEKDGNKFLELPGEPLDSFGLLFGPKQPPEASAGARIQGESTGRRFPEFGVGVGDVGGYRLMLLPGQKKLELRKGDDPVADAPLLQPWTSGTWTQMRLQVRKTADGKWKIEGKAWPADAPEPKVWTLSAETTTAPNAGRASVWGVPFSGKPIRFDDLQQ